MVVPASSIRRRVPGPQSMSHLPPPDSTSTEQELRVREGTQVPEPRMVNRMSGERLIHWA